MENIEKVGLWKTEEQVKTNIEKLQDETKKVVALNQVSKKCCECYLSEQRSISNVRKFKKFHSHRLVANLSYSGKVIR